MLDKTEAEIIIEERVMILQETLLFMIIAQEVQDNEHQVMTDIINPRLVDIRHITHNKCQ